MFDTINTVIVRSKIILPGLAFSLTFFTQDKFVIAMNTTRYCNYSQVLLMMGENIARNM